MRWPHQFRNRTDPLLEVFRAAHEGGTPIRVAYGNNRVCHRSFEGKAKTTTNPLERGLETTSSRSLSKAHDREELLLVNG